MALPLPARAASADLMEATAVDKATSGVTADIDKAQGITIAAQGITGRGGGSNFGSSAPNTPTKKAATPKAKPGGAKK